MGAVALMLADPKLTPVTCGCVAGVVCPAGMVTLTGEIVTLLLSLLDSVTVTPPDGAAVPNVIGNATDWLGPTAMLEGSVIVPGATTVMLAVVSATLGKKLAWRVVVPGATPVTVTVALVALAAMVTVAGTVATPVLLELRFITTPPAGAGADKFSVRFWVAVPVMVAVAGEKLAVAVTCTVWLADV